MSFFGLVALIVLGMEIHIFLRLRSVITNKFAQGALLLGMSVLFCVFFFHHTLFERLPDGVAQLIFIVLAFVIMTWLWVMVMEIVRLLLGAARRVAGKNRKKPLLVGFTPRRLTAIALFMGVFATGYAIYTTYSPRLSYTEIASDKLPEGRDRLRIALVTDLHIGVSIGPQSVERLAELIRESKPDMIVYAGDTVDTAKILERHAERAILKGITAPCGSFSVMGNHEAYIGVGVSRVFMRESGMRVLENDAAYTCGVNVVGIDDPAVASMYYGKTQPDVFALLEQAQAAHPGAFTVLVKHRPGEAAAYAGLYDLQLSGHTHGGQVFPFSLLVRRANGNFAQGLTEVEGVGGRSALMLSNGFGFWGPPLRFGVPPQVNIVDVVRRAQ